VLRQPDYGNRKFACIRINGFAKNLNLLVFSPKKNLNGYNKKRKVSDRFLTGLKIIKRAKKIKQNLRI
jgi:hypothetical protein